MLQRDELKQYNRQLILPELGLTGQEKLKVAKVLIIGAGGLGCPVLQYLVAAGVGTIGIVDDDVIDISNLHRQILYGIHDVGKPKTIVAKQKLELLNAFVVINTHQERLTVDNAEKLIASYDLIIDGSDNFTTRYLVNDTCVELGKTLVFGSIFKFEGHVSVFNHNDGPDYRDVFPEAPADDAIPNCDEIGVIGVLPGMIGTYMANEAIKIICGIGEVLSGKFLTLKALDNSISIFNVVKRKDGLPQSEPIKAERSTINYEINIEEVHRWLNETPDGIYLIDVREEYEFEEFNIGGVNIPLYELKEQVNKLPVDKKLVFCCQTGQRSKMAVQLLKNDYRGEMYSVKHGIST
ncbi:MAG: thiamine biosynthesis protein ThiF [Mucilaginibacter sp.]|nr:thiamine biosynthesis protein ThiF [Mucilaginibacter sp.]